MGDNNNSFKKRLTTTVLCAVASVGVSSDLFGGAPYEIPARLFQWERLPACKEVKVTEEDSTETKIIKCPRDGEYYDSRSLRKFDVSKKRIKSVSFTGFVVPGYVLPDITGYVSITVRQGKVTFGYPFDCKFPRANFLGQGIMSNPIDGDYVRYIAAGTNFSAWATFASSDNMIRWHEDGTFARIEFAPQPDVDGDFLYYRMQNTNNQVTIAGGMKSRYGDSLSFEKYGVKGVAEILSGIAWADSVLAGVSKWVHERPKVSIKDTRKFYVRLESGQRAFAMIYDDRRKLYSPITHAPLAVSRESIVCFEPIDDGAYDEKDCYSKNDVAELWNDFNRGADVGDPWYMKISLWIWGGISSIVLTIIGAIIWKIVLALTRKTKYGRRLVDGAINAGKALDKASGIA